MENTASEISQQSLPGIGGLIKEAWAVFKDHWKNLIRFSLVSVLISYVGGFFLAASVFSIFFGFLTGEPGGSPSWGLIGGSGVIALGVIVAMIITSLWAYTALFEALRIVRQEGGRSVGFKEAFSLGYHRMSGLFVVSFLNALAILGGLILLIVPGIVFLIWFFFSPFVFINENISGKAALRQSKKYVVGRWWNIFGLAAGFWLALVIITSIVQGIVEAITGDMGVLGSLISGLFSGVVGIFSSLLILIYGQLLYEAVKRTAPGNNS